MTAAAGRPPRHEHGPVASTAAGPARVGTAQARWGAVRTGCRRFVPRRLTALRRRAILGRGHALPAYARHTCTEVGMRTSTEVRAGMEIANDTDKDARVRVAGGGSG